MPENPTVIEGVFTVFFTLQPARVVTVDYSDVSLSSIDPKDYFNCNPQVRREHFPAVKTGIEDVHFGLMIPNGKFKTGLAIEEIRNNPHLQPITLADTNAYLRACPDDKRILPLASFCGTISDQGGFDYAAYVQVNKDGVNLFFNWMDFVRNPDGAILVAIRLGGAYR